MAEENPGAESPPTNKNNGAIIAPVNESREVLGNKGETLETNQRLSSIFDKIESGKPAAEAVKEVMTKPKPVAPVEKKEVAEQPIKEQSALEKTLEKTALEKERDDGDAREQLRREKLLAKETEQNPPTPPDKPTEEPKGEEVPEDELKVLEHDKPKTAKRIQALLNKITATNDIVAKTQKERDAQATKLKELETQLSTVKTADPKVDEAIKAQLDELQMYRRQYEIEKDPEFKSRFDDRINGSDKPIVDILKKNRAGDFLLKAIEEEGGWYKFASSNRNFTTTDGRTVTAAEFSDEIMGALPIMDRKAVEASILERIQLTRDKERYVTEEKSKAQDYFKQREEQGKAFNRDQQKQIEDARKAIESFQKEAFEKQDFLKEKQVPADATAEQKAQIEDDNRYTKQLGQLLKQSVSTSELPKILDMVLDSVKYYDERRNTARLSSKVAQLEKAVKEKDAEIAKIKNGARSTGKSGSIVGGGSQQVIRPVPAKSLEEALGRIERGQRPDGTSADEE